MNPLRRLAAFIPVTLSRHILRHGVMEAGVPNDLYAATLFSDISGFTAMSENLASDGARGAEEVNRVLMLTFTAMIDVIHKMGGAVAHFYGDAMAIYFPDEDGTAAARAVSCAQQMQELMLTRFQTVKTHRPPDKDPNFPLTIKIGAGYGRCQELILGDETDGYEFVLRGAAVEQAAEAEKHASASQIIASHSLCQHLDERDNDPADFTNVREQCPSIQAVYEDTSPLLDWEAYDKASLEQLERVLLAFIPSSLHEKLRGMSAIHLAEHRPVTSIFVQFEYENGRLQAYYQHVRAIINRFGAKNGRLNRVLTGDKGNQLHIMFGAPIAPDAPEQAIRCALALQRERPSYISKQQIGLAAGKAFAAPVGASSRSEYTVVGDVVNLSARLTAICKDGGILTDEATARRAQKSIQFSRIPPVHLKGKQGTMIPHYAEGDVAMATQIQAYFGRWQEPPVGREKETAVMLAVMDEAWQAQTPSANGRVLAISGDIGSGKTRLLAAGVQQWLQKGGEGLVGLCQQHLSDTPFAVWHTIWQDFFGLHPAMSADEQAKTVIERTRALLPDVSDDDIGLWGELLGLPIEQTAVLKAMNAETHQLRFFALARRCLHVAATTQPLLIVLEDIHWADEASLKLIDELAARLTDSPLLITLLFRPIDDLPLEILTKATTIQISDLTPQEGRKLMQRLTGEESLPPLVERHLGLRDRDGRNSPVNPLFLEEALNMLTGTGVLKLNGRVQVDEKALEKMPLPDSIYSLLLARLDRLQPARRELLQVASVIGREFALKALDSITHDQDHDTLIELLTGLASAQMTQQIAHDPEWVYLFLHALTHEVAYESLPFARRQILHTAVADWLEAEYADNLKPFYTALSYHYGHTDQHEKGLTYALSAANAARDIFANKEAVEFYTQAERHLTVLGVEERWETAVEIYLSRGNILRYLGELSRGIIDAENMLNFSLMHHHEPYTASAYNLKADLRYRQAQFEDVQELAQKVMVDLGKGVPVVEKAKAAHWLGMSTAALGNYADALKNLQQAKHLCITAHDKNLLARILEGIAYIQYSQKQLDSALLSMQESVNLSRNFSIPANIASALNNIALVQFELGHTEESLHTFKEAATLVQDYNDSFFATILSNHAETLTYAGKLNAAFKTFNIVIAIFSKLEDSHGLAEAYARLGYDFYIFNGEWAQAQEYLKKTDTFIEEYPGTFPRLETKILIGKGIIALENDQIPIATSFFSKAKSIIKSKKLTWWEPIHMYYDAVIQLKQNSPVQAEEALLIAIDATNNNGCPDYLPLIYLQLACLESNDKTKLVYLTYCIEHAEKRARYSDKMKCLQQAGNIYSKFNDPKLQTLGQTYLTTSQKMQEKIKAQEYS